MMTLSNVNTLLSNGVFLTFVIGIPFYGLIKNIKVYEVFVDGAKEGFNLGIKIIPHLVAMLVAIGMLRASGAFTLLGKLLSPLLSKIGMPSDLLPMVLIRPFSGSGANAMMAGIIQNNGGEAFISKLAATVMGSTETTFYVLAVYFGSVNISRTRHAIPAGITADLVGVAASLFVCHLFFTS